jgi:hypothetical protein
MIPALLHGKLTESQENLEDLLTSAVFGALQYVPTEDGLLKFLRESVDPRGEHPRTLPPELIEAQYDFWPWLQEPDCHGAEPDVLIRALDQQGNPHLILIESKFKSGKSSRPDPADSRPNDQLAREWDNLVRICDRTDSIPHMVYLTDDFGPPLIELNESAQEFGLKRPELATKFPLICLWLPWRKIEEVFHTSNNPILRDLSQLARKYGFKAFSGFAPFAPIHKIDWTFSKSNIRFSYWPKTISCPIWRFVK